MKKFLAILMAICMMASLLCVPAFAADELPAPTEGTLLRVTAIKDGKTVLVGDYTNFEEGWHDAVKESLPDYSKWTGYERIIVDFYADWTSADDGNFTSDPWNGANGIGFNNDTIEINDDAKMTINLNGHTIKRVLPDSISDGEVMYIDEDADVIINNGTITGGKSTNGAGGIHIHDADVELNDVHIVGNTTSDDDGGGIAMYDGASLVMNGGSFEKNIVRGTTWNCFGGAIYIEESTANFNNVAFKNNVAKDDNHYGAAIYAEESAVVLNGCTVDGNGIEDADNEYVASISIIHAVESSITVKNTSLTNNGGLYSEGRSYNNNTVSTLIYLNESTLVMDQCGVSKNTLGHLIQSTNKSSFFVTSTNMTYNLATVLKSTSHTAESYFTGCTFGNNNISAYLMDKYSFLKYSFAVDGIVTFYDCDLGNSTFDKNDAEYIQIEHSDVFQEEAVISFIVKYTDGTTSSPLYYKDFLGGWNFAMENAKTNAYDRIVVDLYADWTTRTSNTPDYVLNVPENAKVTFNMNGHTVNAKRVVGIFNGEVIYIGAGADVIINDGTITGGYSSNGAGGIHIKDNANVVLNNVDVVENFTQAGANGSGIAVYDGATLTMNGGSISQSQAAGVTSCGTLYVEEATAILNDVTINDNYAVNTGVEGIAIYAEDSTVTLNNCVVSNNADDTDLDEYVVSIISAYNSKLIIKNTDFTGNGVVSPEIDIDYSHLLYLENSSLTMEGGKITGNNADKLFYFEESKAEIKGVTITDNASVVLDIENDSKKVTLTECVLGNNSPVKYDDDIIVDTKGTLVLIDCDLGDTTFEDKSMVMFSDKTVGSIFGEGSLTMIVALLALITSGVCIFFIVDMKKKLVPVAADNAAEAEDEE